MSLDFTTLLWSLPLVFVLGWFASRFDIRQLRLENRRQPKAYFKGLNFLLNEQQDQAIDAFIEAVQHDPDTSELHFALGNLFRKRGEYERAVRVHEHLLSRADLSSAERDRAQHALAQDYVKAGLLDRAEDALAKLESTAFETQARLARLTIFERLRDWPAAAEISTKLQAAGQGDFSARMAHYLCEQALQVAKAGAGQTTQALNATTPIAANSAATDAAAAQASARALLAHAIEAAPQAARARLALAHSYSQAGEHQAAYRALEPLFAQSHSATALAAKPLGEAAAASGLQADAYALLKASYAKSASIDVLDAIVQLETTSSEQARAHYIHHLEREPSLAVATRWLAGEKLEHEQFHPLVQKALDKAVKPLLRYRCAACGFEAQAYFWQCPGCQAWDSFPTRRVDEL
jgi:lipopolysaccharide assembly protein B